MSEIKQREDGIKRKLQADKTRLEDLKKGTIHQSLASTTALILSTLAGSVSDSLMHYCLLVDVEVDVLYESKRAAVTQFRAQEKEYHDYRASIKQRQKQEFELKKQQERRAYQKAL